MGLELGKGWRFLKCVLRLTLIMMVVPMLTRGNTLWIEFSSCAKRMQEAKTNTNLNAHTVIFHYKSSFFRLSLQL